MRELKVVAIRHVFRKENRVADPLAKEGARSPYFWKKLQFLIPPVYTLEALYAGTVGEVYIRKTNPCNTEICSTNSSGHTVALATVTDMPGNIVFNFP